VYLVPFAAFALFPLAFDPSLPEISLVEGTVLSDWTILLVIVFDSALGAAVAEELLYRGVLLWALEPRGRVLAALLTAALFVLTHFSRVILGASIEEWILGVFLQFPLATALAAVAFRLDSLWPLVVWHFAADITLPLVGTASTTFVLVYLGLSLVIGGMGLWLLWRDRRIARSTDQQPPHKSDVPE
jgi:membrane protease YdiL (CAAX protease family)